MAPPNVLLDPWRAVVRMGLRPSMLPRTDHRGAEAQLLGGVQPSVGRAGPVPRCSVAAPPDWRVDRHRWRASWRPVGPASSLTSDLTLHNSPGVFSTAGDVR